MYLIHCYCLEFYFIDISLNVYCSVCHSWIKLLLMKIEHFLILLLHIKNVQLAKHGVAFIVKQPQETQCICYLGYWC